MPLYNPAATFAAPALTFGRVAAAGSSGNAVQSNATLANSGLNAVVLDYINFQ